MNKQDTERPDGAANRSRLGYLGGGTGLEALEEGGVQSVHRGLPGTGRPASNGAPGPEEPLLDISELTRTLGMRYVHNFALPPHQTDDLNIIAPQTGQLVLTNTGAVLVLQGTVNTRLQMECGRCLAPTEQDISADILEEFELVTTHNAFRQEEVQAVDEDTPAAVIQGNILDLGDLLRQTLILAMPLQPLCREDCPGINLDAGREGITLLVGDAAGREDRTPPLLPNDSNPLRNLARLLNEMDERDTNEVAIARNH